MALQTIKITEKPTYIMLEILEKRIYLGVTDVFAEELSQVLESEFKELIIDLKNVAVMNSSGIGVLIKLRDELINKEKKLKLINLQPLMKDIFTRMRLDILFEIEELGFVQK